MKRIMIFFALVLIAIQVNAQQPEPLSQDEIETLKTRIVEKLDDFQAELKIIGTRSYSDATRDGAIEEAKNLFIGKAGYYKAKQYGTWIDERVDMETSSKNRGTNTQLMCDYLIAIKKLVNFRYDQIIIDRAGSVRVDNVSRQADGRYMATAHIFQKFAGYRDGRLLYDDTTEKTVVVFIDVVPIVTPDGTMKQFVICLEDMNVVETW